MYSARIVQSAWSRWQQVDLDVCVSVFNDGSVYMCDVCVCVCAHVCVCAQTEWGRRKRAVGRESGGCCICVSM